MYYVDLVFGKIYDARFDLIGPKRSKKGHDRVIVRIVCSAEGEGRTNKGHQSSSHVFLRIVFDVSTKAIRVEGVTKCADTTAVS